MDKIVGNGHDCNVIEWHTVDPNYKENRRLISREAERKKKKRKRKSRQKVYGTGSLFLRSLAKAHIVDQPIMGE